MSAAFEQTWTETEDFGLDDPGAAQGPARLSVTPGMVEVRRRGSLSAVVGLVASVVAVLYLKRAADTGAALDWTLTVVMGLVAVYWLRSFVDARLPLLVADAQGVRLRLGRTWSGLRWSAVHHVDHDPQRAWWREGRLVVHPHNVEKVLSELDAPAARQARLATRLWGAPFALPLGVSTRVVGAEGDLTAALAGFAAHADVVVVEGVDTAPSAAGEADAAGTPASGTSVEPSASQVAAPDAEDKTQPNARAEAESESVVDPATDEARESLSERVGGLAGRVQGLWSARRAQRRPDEVSQAAEGVEFHDDAAAPDLTDRSETVVGAALTEPVVRPQTLSPTPEPARDPQPARRSESVVDTPRGPAPLEGRELRVPGRVTLVEETAVRPGVTPIATSGPAVEPLVIDDHAAEPAEDPVIGPELAAARTRLGLSVEGLAERTRIRPHVIEAIEVDDFEPCGGDFYAKGHLRTLARVLGVAPDPLVETYEERYSHAPINPRRVFEADLAGAGHGALRTGRSGPNWSAVVAVVMAVILAWSIARLVMDGPQELRQPPSLGTSSSGTPAAKVSVSVSTGTEGARVVVRDGTDAVVFRGTIPANSSRDLGQVAGPNIKVTSNSDTVRPTIQGKQLPQVGSAGQRSYAAPTS